MGQAQKVEGKANAPPCITARGGRRPGSTYLTDLRFDVQWGGGAMNNRTWWLNRLPNSKFYGVGSLGQFAKFYYSSHSSTSHIGHRREGQPSMLLPALLPRISQTYCQSPGPGIISSARSQRHSSQCAHTGLLQRVPAWPLASRPCHSRRFA